VEKYGTARQATDDNVIHYACFACWITKAAGTFEICNTYCFSIATLSLLWVLYMTCLCTNIDNP